MLDNSENSSESNEELDKTTENSVSAEQSDSGDQADSVSESDTSEATVSGNAEENSVDAETAEAVDQIEEQVAKASEKEKEKVEIPMLDYKAMELEPLVDELEKLIKKYPVQQIKANAEAIKSTFNSKFGALLSEKKATFLAEGGNSIDFQFSSPIKTKYNGLLKDYKTKRDAYYAQQEKILGENLERRNAVIDDLKALIENGNPKTMYNEYQKIQERWKAIGSVARNNYNDVWKLYHYHVERFYDILHLNKDFRELDFKHNLEEKLKLIQRAEILAEKEDVNEAFRELQELHKIWKEEVGPVSREHREEVWQKFSNATKKLHDRRHGFFKELKLQHQVIIEKKIEVIEELNAYDTTKNKTHRDWQQSIKEVEAIRQKYFSAGKLPFSKSEVVWQKFKDATKKFNAAKNAFYKGEKNSQNENLKKKMELVELAESLKDSEDWEETTNVMKRIQSDWKRIGHVPRKFSDEIWKRFKDACNHYFDRLHARKNKLNEADQAVVVAKKEFLDAFKAEGVDGMEGVKEAVSQWRALGRLPRNARHLDGKFNKVIEAQLEKLNLSKSDFELMKFKNSIEGYLAQEDYDRINKEQYYLRKNIDETVREMQQLQNNLSFISNATEDNPLVQNVRRDIQKFKDELDVLQVKLDYVKKLDY